MVLVLKANLSQPKVPVRQAICTVYLSMLPNANRRQKFENYIGAAPSGLVSAQTCRSVW